MEIVNIIVRGLVSLITLFLITKLLGKKQVSQLSLFDYVIGISIGNFAAELTINLESKAINGLVAIIVFGLVAYLVSILTMKSILLRRFFMGTPTILISNGKIILEGLKKVKFDINDLLEECRGSGYFNVEDIAYAVMEANGKLSFIPVSNNRPVTTKDMNLNPKQDRLVSNIIIDGKIMKNNLKNMNKTEKWLLNQIKVKGFELNNILLATLDSEENIKVYEKNVKMQIKSVLE